MENAKKKVKVTKIQEELEQYDNQWDYELMAKKEERYASSIGAFLIWFSHLEHSLDIELAEIINERSHDEGYVIIKDLEMFGKIELLYNLTFPMVDFFKNKNGQKLKEELVSLRKELEDLTILRNKIAHAKWNTLDKDGYIRVDTKVSKEDGLIRFRKFKITPAVMKQEIKRIKVLAEKLSNFTERWSNQGKRSKCH